MTVLFALLLLWVGTEACIPVRFPIHNLCIPRHYGTDGAYMSCNHVLRENLFNSTLFSQYDFFVITSSAVKPMTQELLAQFRAAEGLFVIHTDFETIPAGGFGNFTNIEQLSLSMNCLKVIPTGAFPNSMTKLKVLDLQHNEIHTIENSAFLASSLEELYLGGNNIKSIVGRLNNVSGLTKLSLSGNQLSSIGRDSFRGLTYLRKLYLGWNPIQHIPDDAFADIQALKHLSLTNTRLVSASWIVRAPNNAALQSLISLDLHLNSLHTLPNTTFTTLTNLVRIGLDRNPFNCSEDLEFLRTEFENRPKLFGRSPPPIPVCG